MERIGTHFGLSKDILNMQHLNDCEFLHTILENEGVTGLTYNDGWIESSQTPTKIAALIELNPAERQELSTVTLHIRLAREGFKPFSQNFEGYAPSEEEAILDAYQAFSHTALDPLLLAIWNINEAGYIQEEEWEVGPDLYRACLGNVVGEGEAGKPNEIGAENAKIATESGVVDIPEDYFEALVETIYDNAEGEEFLWFHFNFVYTPGEMPVMELYKNGELVDLEPSELLDIPWPNSNEFYAFRETVILTKKPA